MKMKHFSLYIYVENLVRKTMSKQKKSNLDGAFLLKKRFGTFLGREGKQAWFVNLDDILKITFFELR